MFRSLCPLLVRETTVLKLIDCVQISLSFAGHGDDCIEAAGQSTGTQDGGANQRVGKNQKTTSPDVGTDM